MKQKHILLLAAVVVVIDCSFPVNAACQTARTESTLRASMNPSVERELQLAVLSHSGTNVRNVLLSIENRSERATQLLLVLNRINNDPQLRSELASMLIQSELSAQAVNASHLPLMTQLYLSSIRNPTPLLPRRRGFIDDKVLQSRLLDIGAGVLGLDNVRATLPGDIPPTERLERLLRLGLQDKEAAKRHSREIHDSLSMIESLQKAK